MYDNQSKQVKIDEQTWYTKAARISTFYKLLQAVEVESKLHLPPYFFPQKSWERTQLSLAL